MDRDTRLGLLASAVLEGREVDWREAESTASAEDLETVRQLRLVAEIAAVHRDLPAAPPTARDESEVERRWGHLRLLEQVGRGAFGEVHRAWDTQLDREVALKLLHTRESTADPFGSIGDPGRAVQEGRLLARVRHPNVVTVYGAERRDGRIGMWMEFIDGRTLHDIVTEHGPLGAREATLLALDVCRALAAVHRAGLLHRDLTARNVMREAGGRIVLMDFGAGREAVPQSADETARPTREFAGTPLYLAPELFDGAPADQRTETYSVGVLLFFLVTGTYPIAARTIADVREAHRRGDRKLLRDVRPDLPAGFVQIVERALNADPDRRFQTVGALESVLAETTGAATIAPSSNTRRLWLATAIVGGVALIAGVAALAPRWRNAGAPPDGRTAGRAAATVESGVTMRKLATTVLPMGPSNPSQDGRYVAQMDGTTGDAVVADLVTGEQRRLFIGKGDWSDGYASLLLLSPDASRVAVDWHADDERGRLFIIGSDGQGKRELLGDANLDSYPYQFSQDGSQILAGLVSNDHIRSIALIATADGAVRTIKRLGEATTVPSHAALSPDGRFVVYDYPESGSSNDRDILLIDTHTGVERVLVREPGNDTDPFWTPDGQSVLFLSDRSRALSAWLLPVSLGHATGAAQLVKENVGRVRPRGFTRDGVLHFQLAAGFAEVYVAELDLQSASPAPVQAVAVSPRIAASNYYPEWSLDGRFVAYGSERRESGPRTLWVLDTTTGEERNLVPGFNIGLPRGWSPDGRQLLVQGEQSGVQGLYMVDLADQSVRLIEPALPGDTFGSRLTPRGVVFGKGKAIIVKDPRNAAVLERWDYASADIVSFGLGVDGRSALSLERNGRLTVRDTSTGQTRNWYDSAIGSLRAHAVAPARAEIAYAANGKDDRGDFRVLKLWRGGESQEVIKVRPPETFELVGWARDGVNLLMIRWTDPTESKTAPKPRTLWRVPVDGRPVWLNLSMEGLRDVSLHSDGRHIAFNAGFKRGEFWVMEHFLPAAR